MSTRAHYDIITVAAITMMSTRAHYDIIIFAAITMMSSRAHDDIIITAVEKWCHHVLLCASVSTGGRERSRRANVIYQQAWSRFQHNPSKQEWSVLNPLPVREIPYTLKLFCQGWVSLVSRGAKPALFPGGPSQPCSREGRGVGGGQGRASLWQ